MGEVVDGLKDDLISEVDDYITTTLKGWVIQEVNQLVIYLHTIAGPTMCFVNRC